jgi:HD-GYP domain-containing protein (c-di-GMP phosphodiesterase class II)
MRNSKRALEGLVDKYFRRLEISDENKDSVKSFLKIIELKNTPTYLHSLRTGLLAAVIAASLEKDPKPLFYSGLLHDIGKITIDNGTLCKVDCFDKMDLDKMKAHVMNGYNILKGIHDFSAEILLWHHYFKPHDPYPTEAEMKELQSSLPELLRKKSRAYGLILAFADVYDAMLTRKNSKYNRVIKPNESEQFMLEAFKEHNMSHTETLRELYDKGILGQNYSCFFAKLKEKSAPYFTSAG